MHDVLFSENLFLIVICYLYISSLSDYQGRVHVLRIYFHIQTLW